MAEENKPEPKTCFVIAPIGLEGSDIRRRSDNVLRYIIKPIAKEMGYEAIRADEQTQPGMITNQIIQDIVNDDLVIADLWGRNPNVFYEIAIRHAAKKPVILIAPPGETIPFDIQQHRAIFLDINDIESIENCKNQIRDQINAIEIDPSKVDSPIISALITGEFLRGANLSDINIRIMAMLQSMETRVRSIEYNLKYMEGHTYRQDKLSSYIGNLRDKESVALDSIVLENKSGLKVKFNIITDLNNMARHHIEKLRHKFENDSNFSLGDLKNFLNINPELASCCEIIIMKEEV